MVALKFTCISQFHFVESSYLSDTQAPFFLSLLLSLSFNYSVLFLILSALPSLFCKAPSLSGNPPSNSL